MEYSRKHHGIVQIIPSLYKAYPFPFELYHSRKQDWTFIFNGMVVLLVQIILTISLSHIFTLIKMSIFPGLKIQYISLCTLRRWWGKWDGSSKEEAFPFWLFPPSYPYCRENRMKPSAYGICYLNWAKAITQVPHYISLSGIWIIMVGIWRAARETARVLAKHCCCLKLMEMEWTCTRSTPWTATSTTELSTAVQTS